MKGLSYLLATIVASVVLHSAAAQSCYYQVWSDEFNTDGAPSSANWKAEIGGGGWGNNESQYYTDRLANASVSNGTLKITAARESYGGSSYTSARLISSGKQTFKFGKIEARIKMPYGKGIWPAFWMLGSNIMSGTNWPACGEIDIVEMVGGGINDKVVVGTPHWADASGQHAQYGKSFTNSTALSADFHLYGIEWTSSYIRWYFDGVKFHEMSITPADLSEFQKDFFILLNVAVGGNWPGYPDASTVFPQVMEVDYVRAYSTTMPSASVTGDGLAKVGQVLDFSVDKPLDGVSYTWSVPSDAVINSGQGTTSINVTWGANSGSVACSGKSTCSTFLLTPLAVETIFIPSGTLYNLPLVANAASLWIPSNSFCSVSPNAAANLEVAFDFVGGKTNSYLSCDFGKSVDLSQYSELHLAFKPLSGHLPRNIRVDLLDTDGHVNGSDLFVVSSFNPQHNFYIYSHAFDASATNWKANRIKSARIYVNYGIVNTYTKGTFEIGGIYASKVGGMGVLTTPSDSIFVLPTQDISSNLLWSGNATGGNSVTALQNGTSVDVTWNIVDGASSAKLLYTLQNSLDMGYYNQLEMKLQKDGVSEFPANISVALIDENSLAKADDNWSIVDYSAINSLGFLKHDFGNTLNGGEWLACRTRTIELTINKGVTTASSGKFSIVEQHIVKEPVNTSYKTIDAAFDCLKVYPNPVVDVVNIDLSSFTGSVSLTITDLSSRLLLQSTAVAGSIIPLSTESLAPGVYMLNVIANDNSKSVIVIKK